MNLTKLVRWQQRFNMLEAAMNDMLFKDDVNGDIVFADFDVIDIIKQYFAVQAIGFDKKGSSHSTDVSHLKMGSIHQKKVVKKTHFFPRKTTERHR